MHTSALRKANSLVLLCNPIDVSELQSKNNQHPGRHCAAINNNPCGPLSPLGEDGCESLEINSMKTITIAASSATNIQLDWALAMLLGRAEREPVHAKDADLEGEALPFTLYETTKIYSPNTLSDARVSPIRVTRFGVQNGAKIPTINFLGEDNSEGRGVVGTFYLTSQEAELEAKATLKGYALDFHPTTSWGDCGQLLHDYRVTFEDCGGQQFKARTSLMGRRPGEGRGATHQVAAVRSILAMEFGDTIVVPEDLATLVANWRR